MNEADTLYATRQEQIKLNIAILQKLLKEDAKKQKNHSGDYGFPGSLGYVNEKLDDVISFLGGHPIHMSAGGVLLHPVKNKQGLTVYVTIPKD